MNKRTKKANRRDKRSVQSRRNRRMSRRWKGGHTSSQLVGVILDQKTKDLIDEINNNFGNTSITNNQNFTSNASKLKLTNGSDISKYADNLYNNASTQGTLSTHTDSNVIINNALGLYKELILVGEHFDKEETKISSAVVPVSTSAHAALTLDEINLQRKKLKKNILDLIEFIREMNYLYSPSWVDTLQYKVNSELLRNILNGNIIGFINKLTRPKLQSKSKGFDIKFDTYNSALNIDPTKPLKKKMVLSVNSYGNDPIEDANEMLVELYNNAPKNLMQAITAPVPESTNQHQINMSKHNP